VDSGIRSDPEQWTDERHKRGLAGEERAIRYLQSRGWDIVAHRFRSGAWRSISSRVADTWWRSSK